MCEKSLKATVRDRTQPVSQTVPSTQSTYNLPNSSRSHILLEAIAAGKKIDELPTRRQTINKNIICEVYEKGMARRIFYRNAIGDELTIDIEDINKLEVGNTPAEKLFNFLLIKANEQCTVVNGQKYVKFSLQELVDIGMYSTPQSARKGFRNGIKTLQRILLTVKNKKARLETGGSLVGGYKIKNSVCTVRLGENINWQVFTQYFTVLPKYYFRLSKRASTLLYNIFYYARQHTTDIAKQGYFTVSMKTIHTKMLLPSPKACPNPNVFLDFWPKFNYFADAKENQRLTEYSQKELDDGFTSVNSDYASY